MSDDVRTSAADGVLTVTIDRPEQRNALSPAVNAALLGALDGAAADDGVRAVVLTGAGDRAFCAGADLGGLSPDAGAVEVHRGLSLFADLISRIRRLPKAVIARVNGAAVGGGFGLALACDLVVAADDATFGTPEVRVGLWPYVISAVISEHIGPKRAMELMLGGQRIDAAKALEWGLVNHVVARSELDATVAGIAGDIAALSPVVVSLGKESAAMTAELTREQALPYLAGMLGLHLRTEDAAEGMTAFLEKRPPQWKGR